MSLIKKKILSSIKRKNHSLFFRFFLSLLLVSLCSVIILTIFYFYWFREKTAADIERVQNLTLLNTSNVFSNYVDFSQNYTMELYNNPDIQSAILTDNIDWNERLQILLGQINRSGRINKYIDSVYVFNHNGLVLNVEHTPITDDDKKNMFHLIKNTNIKDSPVFWHLHSRSNGTEINVMTVFFRDFSLKNERFEGAVAVNIDMNELQKKIFSQQSVGKQNLFIIDSSGRVIMQLGEEQVEQSVWSFIGKRLSKNKTFESFTTMIHDNNYSFSYVSSKDHKYYVVLQEKYDLTMSELIKTKNVMLSLCSVLLLIITLISVLLSYRIYKPIGHVFLNIRKLAEDLTDQSEHRNEVQNVTLTLSKIVKRMKSLEKENESNEIMKLLTSPTEKEELNFADLLTKSGTISSIGAHFCVIQMKIHDFKGLTDTMKTDRVLFQMNSICSLLCDVVEQVAHGKAFQSSDGHIVLVVSESAGSILLAEIDMISLMKKAQEMIREVFEWDVMIGISSITDDVHNMKSKYNEALDITRYRIVFGRDSIIRADTIEEWCRNDIPESFIDAVLDTVKKGSLEQYGNALDNMFSVSKGYTLPGIVKAFSRLIATIMQLTSDVLLEKGPAQNTNLLDIYNRVSHLDSYEELRNWLDSLFHQTSTIIENANTKKTLNIIIEVIQKVNTHYHDPQLSVHYMANKLAISVPYFSKLFNDYTGSSFPDYVNNIRLERAMELLIQDKNTDIGEIAQKAGYNSSTYFTTLFKKKYGVTPSKYRLINILKK